MKRAAVPVLCCLVFLGNAGWIPAHSAPPPKTSFRSADPLPETPWKMPALSYFIEHLPPPPRPDSFRDRMDFEDVIARQKASRPEDLNSIQQTYLFDVFYFSKVLGPNFKGKNYPKTRDFFKKLETTADVVIHGLKNYYQRPRPFEGHPDQVRLLVKNEPGFGYPSGHTTRSRLAALVMTQLAPEYKKQFFTASELVATDRVLAGEHYVTDLEAGRHLGKMLFVLLVQDPKFQADLAAVKAAEWTPPRTTLFPPKP